MSPSPLRRSRTVQTALSVLLLMAGVALLAPPSAWGQGTVVYLVRHAEKEAEPAADPPLTAEGQARARALAHALADAGLTAIWSSDYARTRDTAVPVAEGTGLDVQLYDPRDLPGFASALRAQAGRFLVVGHSNTTPALVAMLGGEPGQPIDEPSEYDRLYVLVINGGVTTTTLLRFGEPSPGR